MACICQYFVTSKNRKLVGPNLLRVTGVGGGGVGVEVKKGDDHLKSENNIDAIDEKEHSIGSSEVSASELAASKAEVWVLRKQLSDAQITIENLENLVRTIISKQNELLSEMYELKTQNEELQNECRMQRDYQTMERNAMIRELHDIKLLLGNRTKIFEETVEKNSELTNALQDANEKIYMMGMKFLKLKSSRSKYSPCGHVSAALSERSS